MADEPAEGSGAVRPPTVATDQGSQALVPSGPAQVQPYTPMPLDPQSLATALGSPGLEECVAHFEDWERYAEEQISKASNDIEMREAEVKKGDDELLLRSIRTQVGGVTLGVLATALGATGLVMAAAAVSVVASLLSIDGPIRSYQWRRRKKPVEAAIAEAKKKRQEWLDEKDLVGKALRGIERQIDPQLSSRVSPASKQLLPGLSSPAPHLKPTGQSPSPKQLPAGQRSKPLSPNHKHRSHKKRR